MAHKTLEYSVILIGDSGAGKTCMMRRFTHNKFDTTHKFTIGADFELKTFELNGKKIRLQVWDTAGQERFNTITTSYYRGADGILLVYDVTNQKSFDNVTKWLKRIEEHASEDVKKILIGNKCDLEDKRMVPTGMGELLAKEYGMKFFETSAKRNTNIDEAFRSIAADIMNKKTLNEAKTNKGIKITAYNMNPRRRCC